MGQTLKVLSEQKDNVIFSTRMVIEVCESIHLHYRNLRLLLSESDWIKFAEGVRDSLSRWEKLGKPSPSEGQHIELCRKQLSNCPSFSVKVNLNKNLYAQHEGKIFSDGADLEDETYIHLKLNDCRLELTKSQFDTLAKAVKEAEAKLEE